MNLSHIAEPLRPLAVPIESLNLDPTNARSHDERNIAAIRASLARFGQRLPVVVQREGMVVRAGNGRVIAARELGWTHVAAVVVDESEVEATSFAIADNRSAELATWDEKALADLFDSLPGDILPATGFTEAELDRLLGDSEQEPPTPIVIKSGVVDFAWVLVGVPIGEFDRLDGLVEAAKQIPSSVIETCVGTKN